MVDEGLTDALERIAYGSVAITNLALVEAGVEVTFPQWRVLVVVGGSTDGAAVSEIATRIGAAVSPASKLVTRLERRGLLRTAKDQTDRRVTRVRLTEAGVALRAHVLQCRRDHLRRIVASVGPGPAGMDGYLAKLGEAFASFG